MAREPLEPAAPPDLLLELIDADLAPPGRKDPVLRGVTLRLARGTVSVLLGGNGSGKTTLLRSVAGLWPLRAGRMLPSPDRGYDVRRAGLLLEDPASQFIAGTVAGEVEFGLENLGWGASEIRRRREEVLAPLGLSTLAAVDPRHLSPGEQELVLVAAVLAPAPPLLLLDDPFLYLGPGDTRRAWACVLDGVRSGSIGAVLLACHESERARDADHVGILGDGRLRWGSPEILREPLPPGVVPLGYPTAGGEPDDAA